jgi:hypothetical protein
LTPWRNQVTCAPGATGLGVPNWVVENWIGGTCADATWESETMAIRRTPAVAAPHCQALSTASS